MNENIVVPVLGESITEATVSKWLKKSGDKVNADEPIVELETDKVNLEVPSPINGILSQIKKKEGETAQIGALLGVISYGEKTDTKVSATEESSEKTTNVVSFEKNKVAEPKIFDEKKDEEPLILTEEPLILTEEIHKEEVSKTNNNINLSPAVRKIVKDKNIDISKVHGTGKDGRILKGDLINLMSSKPLPNKRKLEKGQEERVKMTRLRQTIAKRLKEAQNTAAMLTTFNEVDMSAMIQIRRDNQEDFQKTFGIKLGFMSFFVKACVLGLKLFPSINAEVDNDHIIYKNYYNISFAVGTDRGLVVPVLRNADELSFADIEKNIKIISEKARDGNLTIEDLQGGTFTISNGGVYGSMLSTPILNPPQSGVLGMHNIIERPIAVDGQVKVRSVMYLALSYDHRIIDGKDSVSFLKTVKENLEDPRKLFLNI
jgi:2-oxoglutarate dehydrogenase E2 component (dihydrolipoamide succinyltransferase)|tara:strand:+ start:1424 stop:2716 length:1293 start_codon:yes stop_codon:yes gene_type:complete